MYSKDSKVSDDQVNTHLDNLKKDTVGVENYRGKYRLNIARNYSRLYFKDKDGKPATQKRIATGLSILDSKGKIDKSNADAIALMTSKIHNDLIHGEGKNFDVTLVKYGLLGTVPKDEPEVKKQKSLLELYDWYCESKKSLLAETTFKLAYQGRNRRALVRALEAGNTSALDIRNHLLLNSCHQVAKVILSTLEHAYNQGMKHGECTNNPFIDMAKEIKLKNKPKINDDEEEDNDKRAFSINEMNAIIEAFEQGHQRKHFAPIIKFLFWTGCRTGEAIGFQWRDIKWDKQVICIRRTFNRELRIFKPTKNGIVRWFPMPKDGRLWNLLKSLPEGKPDEVVFKAKKGGIIYHSNLTEIWVGKGTSRHPGVIKRLIAQGKVSQYLQLYGTRHTFITIQIRDEGIASETVAQWCGHTENVTKKSYLDKDRDTVPGETTTSTKQQSKTDNDAVKDLIASIANLTPEQLNELKASLNK